MAELPTTQSELLEFFTAHTSRWEASAMQIGASPALVAAFAERAAAARTAVEAAESARIAARAATLDAETALARARGDAADLIKTIRAFAQSTSNPGVYSIAGISPPASRAPAPRPSTPTNLSSTLASGGALTLYWNAKNPRGGTVTYTIARKLPGDAAFTIIASTGGSTAANGRPSGHRGPKRWTDRTLPVNCNGVQYTITGVRGDISGETSERLTVTFGVVASNGRGAHASTRMDAGVQMAA